MLYLNSDDLKTGSVGTDQTQVQSARTANAEGGEFGTRNLVGHLPVVATAPLDAAKTLCSLALKTTQRGEHVHLINAYTVAIADRDPAFAAILQDRGINLPDGKPLSWLSRVRRDPIPLSQVRGPKFFLDVFDIGREFGLKHYLLGSTESVLTRLEKELTDRFPGAEIVGSFSPPFRQMGDDELHAQDEAVRASGAHVVWVGLGTPKQDYEARRLADGLPVTAVAVGAAFDFAAGTTREAPAILRALGLEWAYRFATEPRRLWRRYVFGNARFLRAALRRSETSSGPC